MKISVLAAVIVLVGCVVSCQMLGGPPPPPGWNYYNFQYPYSPLLDGSSHHKDPILCLRELRVTSQRLKETSGIVGHLKSQLNALEKNTQRLAEKMVSGWVWTSKKFEETSQKSTEISNRLNETKDMVVNLIVYVKELMATTTSSTSAASTDIGRMPNNCLDLQLIGHTKSGLYSVITEQTSVGTVYCDFSKRPGDPGFQKWIGYNDVKSTPTFFHVQKNMGFSLIGVPIPFEVEKSNIGNAMDLETGIFTTLKSGIYHFSFSGLARFESDSSGDLELRLYLNGDRMGSSYSTKSSGWSSVTDVKFNQINLQLSLKLQDSDRIWLEIHTHGGSSGISIYDAVDWHHTHFTGLLLEEDFE